MYWVIDDSISCQCLLVAQFVDCCTVSQKEDGPASGLSCLQWGILIQIISQMFLGDPQAMNLGNEVKKKKETWILGQFVRKNQSFTSELWHLICCCFYSFFFFKFPEDLLFVFCCRFRKNGFDILFTNCRTNQKFHVLVNLKALCIMYKWCAL